MNCIRLLMLTLGLGIGICTSAPKAQLLQGFDAVALDNMPDTVQYGDTIHNLSAVLVNNGLLSILGIPLDVNGFIVNTGFTTILASINIPTSLPIFPGDTMVVPLNSFVVTPQNSNTGSNVMVIWPAAPGFLPGDSASDTYYVDTVTTTTSLTPAQGLTDVRISPNPCEDWLKITTPDVTALLSSRVLDVQGRVLASYPAGMDRLRVDSLPPGVYLLEIRGVEGERIAKRFVKL